MIPSHSIPSLLGVAAVYSDMPWFPGKLLVVLLIGLSILAWGLIIAKTLFLRRLVREDRHFVRRLKNSSRILEVYSEGETCVWSPFFEVYRGGCEAAQALADLVVPPVDGSCQPSPFDSIGMGLAQGESRAGLRIGRGFHLLRLVCMAATLLGFFGAVWMLFVSINSEGEEFLRHVSFAITLLLLAALVAFPSFVCRSFLLKRYRKKLAGIRLFREQLAGIFLRELAESGKQTEAACKPSENLVAKGESRSACAAIFPGPEPVIHRPTTESQIADPPSPILANPQAPEPSETAEHPLVAINRARILEEQQEERSAREFSPCVLPETTPPRPDAAVVLSPSPSARAPLNSLKRGRTSTRSTAALPHDREDSADSFRDIIWSVRRDQANSSSLATIATNHKKG